MVPTIIRNHMRVGPPPLTQTYRIVWIYRKLGSFCNLAFSSLGRPVLSAQAPGFAIHNHLCMGLLPLTRTRCIIGAYQKLGSFGNCAFSGLGPQSRRPTPGGSEIGFVSKFALFRSAQPPTTLRAVSAPNTGSFGSLSRPICRSTDAWSQ